MDTDENQFSINRAASRKQIPINDMKAHMLVSPLIVDGPSWSSPVFANGALYVAIQQGASTPPSPRPARP